MKDFGPSTNKTANIYLLKVSNRNTRKKCKIPSKLTKNQNDVNEFLLLIWNKEMLAKEALRKLNACFSLIRKFEDFLLC